ncbi:MAG: MltA domain-containing protein [Rickettsiales bacterium]|nr:MltA domain-containing protein [Rickettsiales bacterium]
MIKNSVIFLLLILCACFAYQKITIKGRGNLKLEQVDFSTIAGWQEDDHKKALQAFIHSCNKFSKMPQNRFIGGQIGDITVGDFRDVCEIAQVVKTMSAKQAKNFFENWFKVFLVSDKAGKSQGLFTGYYEADLNGSAVKSEKFQYPIYAKPKDLTSEPYLTRKEITEGALEHKGLELLYVDDAAELFFMHIQGSGRINLPDNTIMRLTFAGRNNQPFIGITNYMIDQGYISRDKTDAESIKNWLKDNPDKALEVMNINPAYTFFKFSDGEYVVGAQGVPLTPERSLAIDNNIFSYGFPFWLDTVLTKKGDVKEKYQHLFIAQDTGSAIKGTVRGDIFFGHGKDAEERASYTAATGKYYILLPINVVDKMI